MSHEITEQDGLVLHRNRAWHGLGTVVEDAPDPHEALKIAKLDWNVVQAPLFASRPTETEDEDGDPITSSVSVAVESHVANFRGDTGSLLGVVSKGYQPVTNFDMADFCNALLDEGQVKIETAGSVRGGKKVWMLLKGEPFQVANGDSMHPYILVSNGHDGSATFRVTPTTVRAVCSNTLHMVIPNYDTGQLKESVISIKHTRNIMERVEDARRALQRYGEALEETQELANTLSGKEMDDESIKRFFLDCYSADFGAVPDSPTNNKEKRRREKAMDAYNSFRRRYDDEKEIAGASLWNAVNAYSGLVQHDKKSRGKSDADRVEKRLDSNLFGLNAQRTVNAFRRAFELVT